MDTMGFAFFLPGGLAGLLILVIPNVGRMFRKEGEPKRLGIAGQRSPGSILSRPPEMLALDDLDCYDPRKFLRSTRRRPPRLLRCDTTEAAFARPKSIGGH